MIMIIVTYLIVLQETPTKGLHLIFLRPQEYHLGQDIGFLEGVDIKASRNNYAPSKTNGQAYHFFDALTKHPLNCLQF